MKCSSSSWRAGMKHITSEFQTNVHIRLHFGEPYNTLHSRTPTVSGPAAWSIPRARTDESARPSLPPHSSTIGITDACVVPMVWGAH